MGAIFPGGDELKPRGRYNFARTSGQLCRRGMYKHL